MEPDLRQLEIEIEDARALVKRKQALEKLESNREFKSIILEHLFKEEAARLAEIIAEPGLAQHKGQIIGELDAISNLHQFFRRIRQQGQLAAQALAEAEEARDELLAEAAE